MVTLEFLANTAAIATPVVGVFLWGNYKCGFHRKRKSLENYLEETFKSYKQDCYKKHQFSFPHLTAKLGLTESEILQASFDNPRIKRVENLDKNNKFTEKILFQYNDANTH